MLLAKRYPESRIAGVTAQLRQESDLTALQACWEGWLANDQMSILVAPDLASFALAVHAQTDFSTGQPETIVVEQVGLNQGLVQAVRERARHWNDEFVAFRHYPEEVELGEQLPELGFAPELTRITRTCLPAAAVAVPVRPVGPEDRPFLSRLHLECSPFYQSSNRRLVDTSAFEAVANYLSLDLSDRGEIFGQICPEFRGYVLLRRDFPLDLVSRKGVYLYDIAVTQAARGQQLAASLHEAAMLEAAARGYETVVGDIAFENRRAFAVATEKLSYRVEWRRWGINLES